MLSTTDTVNMTLFTVELFGAVCGNVLLLLAVHFTKDLHRSVSSNLIFNSAVIDLVSVIVVIPLAMDYLICQTGNLSGTFAPMIINSMFTFWMILMQLSAVVLMADRLMIIKNPSCYNNIATVKKARLVIGIMWLSVICCTCVVYTARGLQTPQIYASPLEYMSRQHLKNGKYVTFLVSLTSILGNGAICAMVRCTLAKYLKKKNELWKSIPEGSGNANLQRMKAEMAKNTIKCNTVLIVLATFIMSVFPSCIHSFVKLVDDFSTPQHTQVSTIVIMTTQLNSFLNPYVLIYRSTRHRQILKRKFRKLFGISGNRTVPASFPVNVLPKRDVAAADLKID